MNEDAVEIGPSITGNMPIFCHVKGCSDYIWVYMPEVLVLLYSLMDAHRIAVVHRLVICKKIHLLFCKNTFAILQKYKYKYSVLQPISWTKTKLNLIDARIAVVHQLLDDGHWWKVSRKCDGSR